MSIPTHQHKALLAISFSHRKTLESPDQDSLSQPVRWYLVSS